MFLFHYYYYFLVLQEYSFLLLGRGFSCSSDAKLACLQGCKNSNSATIDMPEGACAMYIFVFV